MDVSRIRRIAALLLIMCLLPSGAPAEETADDDWRSAWEEYGIFEYCDVQDDTLILLHICNKHCFSAPHTVHGGGGYASGVARALTAGV